MKKATKKKNNIQEMCKCFCHQEEQCLRDGDCSCSICYKNHLKHTPPTKCGCCGGSNQGYGGGGGHCPHCPLDQEQPAGGCSCDKTGNSICVEHYKKKFEPAGHTYSKYCGHCQNPGTSAAGGWDGTSMGGGSNQPAEKKHKCKFTYPTDAGIMCLKCKQLKSYATARAIWEGTDGFVKLVGEIKEWFEFEEIDLGYPVHDMVLGRMASRVQSLLLSQKKLLRDSVKEMINEDVWEDLDESKDWDMKTGMVREGYNQALDDVLKILESEEGK